MTKMMVDPGKTIAVPYDLPAGHPVTVRVSATDRVNVMLTDAEGRAQFLGGSKSFPTWVRADAQLDCVTTAVLPPRAKWFLLIENTTNQIADVEYEIVAGVASVPTGTLGYGGVGIFGSRRR